MDTNDEWLTQLLSDPCPRWINCGWGIMIEYFFGNAHLQVSLIIQQQIITKLRWIHSSLWSLKTKFTNKYVLSTTFEMEIKCWTPFCMVWNSILYIPVYHVYRLWEQLSPQQLSAQITRFKGRMELTCWKWAHILPNKRGRGQNIP